MVKKPKPNLAEAKQLGHDNKEVQHFVEKETS